MESFGGIFPPPPPPFSNDAGRQPPLGTRRRGPGSASRPRPAPTTRLIPTMCRRALPKPIARTSAHGPCATTPPGAGTGNPPRGWSVPTGDPLRDGNPPPAALFRDPDATRLQKNRLPPSPLRGFPCPSALSAPSARARLISQITSRKVPRPPLPSDLPGSYRLSAPAGRSSSHPGAINAPKSSFPWRYLN